MTERLKEASLVVIPVAIEAAAVALFIAAGFVWCCIGAGA